MSFEDWAHTIIVNAWSSTCGACGQGANPEEKSHQTVLSLHTGNTPGCGTAFHYAASKYTSDKEYLSEQFPHYTWVGVVMGIHPDYELYQSWL